MRPSFWASVALCWIISGCQESQPVVPAANTAGKAETQEIPAANVEAGAPAEADVVRSGEFIIGEPVRYENLAVFPISTAVAKENDRFVTLDEGLKAGTVEVMEVGMHLVADVSAADERLLGNQAFRDVNHLQVVNRSDKPLYLMPGEIIVGGQQDRCIGSETIVEAGGQPASVDVYCVEHGRWGSRQMAELAPLAGAFGWHGPIDGNELAELTQEAASGKFVGSAGNLSKKARHSAQSGGGQSRVWADVGLANATNGADTPTDTFTGNYAQLDVQEKLSSYVDHLENAVAAMDRVVGVVVAINGKVEMADVYESTPLFKKLWPKLLKSYALDAIGVADEDDASKVCEAADAGTFLDQAREADVQKTDEKGGLIVTARSSKNIESFSAGMGGAGFGGSVHSAGFGR